MLKLGSKGRDIISGFEGIVIGHCTYLTGCNQTLLAPRGLGTDGRKIESEWFDDVPIEAVDGEPEIILQTAAIEAQQPGADRQAPKK